VVRKIAEMLAGRAAVVQIDTQENQQMAGRFNVRGIPALYFLRDGRVVDHLAGAQSPETIINWFRRLEQK